MIFKDSAVVLRIHPFGNTSRIVVWLSRSYGKLATLVKGSQREKSPFLGQYDLFYGCEILFYSREQRNLHVLKECAPLDVRPALRTDWRACAVASYAVSLLDRTLPFGPASLGLYAWLEDALDRLAARTPGPAFLPRIELRLLDELGLAPDWNVCAKCRADLRGAAARLDVAHGAVRCPTCAAGQGAAVSAAALDAIRQMRGATLPAALPDRVFREVRAIAGGLLEHQADVAPTARDIAFQVLAAG